MVTGQSTEEASPLNKKKKCFACGKLGHLKFQCRNVQCNYCKKKGHVIKDCYAKKRVEERNKSINNGGCALITVSSIAQAQVNVEWFLDSGASHHM